MLFMDDLMLFGHGFMNELEKLKDLLNLYCKATWMEINQNKSLLLFNELADDIKTQAAAYFWRLVILKKG